MAGVNRFMKPQKANYFQTYVSQYVPQPFELMQRAADNAQAQYDAVAQNIEDQDAFLGKLSTHSGADTEYMKQYIGLYQKQLDDIMNSGDLRLREEQVRKLGRQIGEDYHYGQLGKYVASGQTEKAYFKAKEEARTKSLGKGGWSTEREQYLEDYHKRHQEGGLEKYDHTLTRTHRGSPDVNAEVERLGKQIKDSTSIDNPFMNPGQWNNFQIFFDKNYEGISASRAEASIFYGLKQNPDIREEARIRAAVRNSTHPSLYEPSQEEIDREILDMATPGINAYTHSTGDTDASLHAIPEFGVGGSSYDPNYSYSFANSSATSQTVDPEKLESSITANNQRISEVHKAIADLENLPKTSSNITRLEELRSEDRKLQNQKRRQKATLSGMAEKAGFNWEEQYDNFLGDLMVGTSYSDDLNNNVQSDSTGVIGYSTSRVTPTYYDRNSEEYKAKLNEYKQNPPFSIDEFKDMVATGGYISKTPFAVNYDDPSFKDRNVDYNLLDTYTKPFIEAINDPKAKNFAVESTLMSGGSKTYLSHLTKDINKWVKSGVALELFNVDDGTQFDINGWDARDVTKGEVTASLESTFIGGKPTLQLNAKGQDGKIVTKRVTVEDPNSPIAISLGNVGWEMMNRAQGESKYKQQTFTEGAYIYGSLNFPDLIPEELVTLPLNQTYNHELPNGTISITPTFVKGEKQYEARFNGKPILNNAVVFDKPDDIITALGTSLYMIRKQKEEASKEK